MSRLIQASAAAIIFLGLTATGVRADLTITLSDVALTAGTTGTMDITVTSNHGYTLSDFNLELVITPASSGLYFSPGADQPTAPFSSSNTTPFPYVFAGGSSAADIPLAFWSDPSSTFPYDGSTITGGDSSDSSRGYVFVRGGTTKYLAAVQVYAPLKALGTFQISLVPDPGYTYFQDKNGNALNYCSTPGTVTVAAAVPEPSSMTVVALSGFSGLLWCYWRGRKRGRSKNSPLYTSKE